MFYPAELKQGLASAIYMHWLLNKMGICKNKFKVSEIFKNNVLQKFSAMYMVFRMIKILTTK